MTSGPEAIARRRIDAQLAAAGWVLQGARDFNRSAATGVAMREFQLPSGPYDYLMFEAGRAGEGIRKRLLENFNFHTLLRLPTGIWYSRSVKANVLFFDKKGTSKQAQTKKLWVYDYRTNVHKTLKTKPLARPDLDDFVECYRARKETDRFHAFPYDELIKRDKLNLDLFWLKDDGLEDVDALPEPGLLAAEIIENLESALEQFRAIVSGEADGL